MKHSVSVGWGIVWGSLIAGPTFVAATAGALLYATLPQAIPVEGGWIDPETVMALILLIIPVGLFGFLLAFIPNAVGATLIGSLGRRFELARLPLVWAVAGVAMTTIPLALLGSFFGDQAPTAVGLVITSGLCALMCRRHTRWFDEPPVTLNPAPTSVSPPAQSALAPRNTGARLLD